MATSFSFRPVEWVQPCPGNGWYTITHPVGLHPTSYHLYFVASPELEKVGEFEVYADAVSAAEVHWETKRKRYSRG